MAWQRPHHERGFQYEPDPDERNHDGDHDSGRFPFLTGSSHLGSRTVGHRGHRRKTPIGREKGRIRWQGIVRVEQTGYEYLNIVRYKTQISRSCPPTSVKKLYLVSLLLPTCLSHRHPTEQFATVPSAPDLLLFEPCMSISSGLTGHPMQNIFLLYSITTLKLLHQWLATRLVRPSYRPHPNVHFQIAKSEAPSSRGGAPSLIQHAGPPSLG